MSLVVDCSGSMRAQEKINGKYITRISIAMQSAYIMCDVLTKLNISCEVIGFTTNRSKNIGGEYGFSRYEPLYMPLFKAFGERFSLEQKQRMFEVQMNSGKGMEILANNVDGECVRIAAKRLITLGKCKSKTMIVLSDGRPEAYGDKAAQSKDLQRATKEITLAGINLLGIGIGDNSVKHYYPKYAVLSHIDELPQVLLQSLSNVLLK